MAKTVLLIEDEPNLKEAVSFILERDGWVVHVHGDGATAIETVTRVAPDIVILDVMLPGRSGLDILRDLRLAALAAGLHAVAVDLLHGLDRSTARWVYAARSGSNS
jgi:DNA-binding response OmpR family regulator